MYVCKSKTGARYFGDGRAIRMDECVYVERESRKSRRKKGSGEWNGGEDLLSRGSVFVSSMVWGELNEIF